MPPLAKARYIAWVLSPVVAACTPPPHWIAVGDAETGSILLFDHELSVADTVSLTSAELGTSALHSIELGRDGVSLYVADLGEEGTGQVSRIRRFDGKLMDRWQLPQGRILDLIALPDSPSLVVMVGTTDEANPGSIYYLSTKRLAVESRFQPCRGNPRGFATLQEVDRAYVRCDDAGETVVDLDLIQQRSVGTMRLDGNGSGVPACGPGGISLSQTGAILFVPCGLSGMLLSLDRVTLETLDTALIGAGIFYVNVSYRNALALVSLPDSNSVALVDLPNGTASTRIELPGRPVSVVMGGDGGSAYVLTRGSQAKLVQIELRSGSIQRMVPVPTGSTNLSIWPGTQSPFMIWR